MFRSHFIMRMTAGVMLCMQLLCSVPIRAGTARISMELEPEETVQELTLGMDEESEECFELLVAAEDSDQLLSEQEIVSEMDGVFLTKYENAEEYRAAYQYYQEHLEFVEENVLIYCADETKEESVSEATEQGKDLELCELERMEQEEKKKEEQEKKEKEIRGFDSAGKVALIDSGVNSDRVLERISLISDSVEDENGHGTRMLQEMEQVNPDLEVISIKVLNPDGEGRLSDIYAAIELAIVKDVQVINLSLSGLAGTESYVLRKAIRDAREDGIYVVGAAGNNGADVRDYLPGNIPEAWIIGSANQDGTIKHSSNYGATVDYYVSSESTSNAAARFSALLSAFGEDGLTEQLRRQYGVFLNSSSEEQETEEKEEHESGEEDGFLHEAAAKYSPDSENWVKAMKDMNGTRFYSDWEGDDAICIMDAASNMAVGAYLDVKTEYYSEGELNNLLFWITQDYDVKTPNGKDDISNIMRWFFALERGGDFYKYNQQVLENTTRTHDGKLITDIIQKYRGQKVPVKYVFQVKYLGQDESLNGKPSRGGSGLESERYQDFLSWRLTERKKSYGVIEKILQTQDGSMPLEGIEFGIYLKNAAAGSWFATHEIITIKTDSNGIAVWKGGGRGLGLAADADIDLNGVPDLEQGYYAVEKINQVTIENHISVDEERQYDIPLYSMLDENRIPDSEALKASHQGVLVENTVQEFYLRIEKSAFTGTRSFEGIEYTLWTPDRKAFAVFLLDRNGRISEKSCLKEEWISKDGGRDGLPVLSSEIIRISDAGQQEYCYLHWYVNLKNWYTHTKDTATYGWTLTETKANSNYVLNAAKSGQFAIRPNQKRVLAYSATIPSLKDNQREYVALKKRAAPEYDELVKDVSGFSLEGTEYEVYLSKSDAEQKRNAIGKLTTNKEGVSNKLDVSGWMKKDAEGKFLNTIFYFREKTAGKGYLVSDEILEKKIIPGAGDYIIEARDRPDVCGIRIDKSGLSDGRNAQFQISFLGKQLTFKEVSEGNYIHSELAGSTNTLVPDKEGLLEIRGLAEGDYSLSEIKTEEGKQLLCRNVTIEVKRVNGALRAVMNQDGKEISLDKDTDEQNLPLFQLQIENHNGVYLSAGGSRDMTCYWFSAIFVINAILLGGFFGKEEGIWKKKRGCCIFRIFTGAILLGGMLFGLSETSLSVYAKEEDACDEVEWEAEIQDKTITTDRECIIRFFYFDDDGMTRPIDEAEFEVVKLADIGEMGELIPVSQEVSLQGFLALEKTGISKKKQTELAEFIEKEENQKLIQTVRIQKGRAECMAGPGLFYIREVKSAERHLKSEPCLIQLPFVDESVESGQFWNYERDVYPKAVRCGEFYLEKVLMGNSVETKREFHFEILINANGSFDYEKNDGTKGTVRSGDTVALKGGERITIYGIPEGTDYGVKEKEENQDGYETSYQDGTGRISAEEVRGVIVVNTRNETPKTGDEGIGTYVIGLIGSLFGIAVIWISRRNERKEE